MEERMKRYKQVSPERAKVWTEKSPKYRYNHQHYNQQQQTRKVSVVYYLCQNRQLEHPHFMEVPLPSFSDDLHLRDVIERLNVLRGRGFGSMYSWSCKRSYKNGYVWHDLCDDDIIHPAHGNEYILKGSELFQESNHGSFNPAKNFTTQTQKALASPPSSKNKEESSSSSSSSSSNGKTTRRDDLADASTQTEEEFIRVVESRRTCTRGVSTDDDLSKPHQIQVFEQNPEICRDVVSPRGLSGRTDTLESLIRADVRKLNSLRIFEEEGFQIPSSTKLKAANMIMQLVSCGSLSVKDRSFGLIPAYRPRISNPKFPSQFLATSLTMGEVDCSTENPSIMGMILEDKETGYKRETEKLSGEKQSGKPDSSKNDEENVIKIEERLASGARVIIQSKVSMD